MERYQIYKTHARFVPKFSSFSPFLLFLLFSPLLSFSPVSTFLVNFFLIIITSMKVAKINTSFWFFIFKIFAGVMVFFFAEKVFDTREIFFSFFGKSDNLCYIKVLTLSLSLSIIVSKTSFMVLVFFISLVLVSKRLLLLIKYINKRGVSRLIFLGVLIFLFCWFVTSKILDTNLSYARR